MQSISSGIRRLPKTTSLLALVVLAAGLCFVSWRMIVRMAYLAIERRISVMAYAAGDGVTDDGSAFAAALAAATRNHVPLVIPRRTYLVNRNLAIPTGMVIMSDGATLIHTEEGIPILSASGSDDWVIQGPLTLKGTRGGPAETAGETGLKIFNASRYVIDKLTVRDFKGVGIDITADSLGTTKGDHGKFAFVSFINNRLGLRVGAEAEYNLFMLLTFSGNETATDIAGGNNVIVASNVVSNDVGVRLSGGINAGHGILSASNINHNRRFNVEAVDVSNGFTFNGCHVYGDSATSGVIALSDSQGVHFGGGDIDAAVIDDGGSLNLADENLLPGSYFSVGGSNFGAFANALNFDRRCLQNESGKPGRCVQSMHR